MRYSNGLDGMRFIESDSKFDEIKRLKKIKEESSKKKAIESFKKAKNKRK